MRTIATTLLLLFLPRFVSGQDAGSPQTTESNFLWAYMTQAGGPDNWVRVDLRPKVVRDPAGAIESGGMTWRLRWSVASQLQVVSLRIHGKDDAGASREAFRLDFSPPLQLQGLATAGGTISTMGTTIAVRAEDREAIEAFRRLLDNPSEHTVTLDVQGQPEGVFRAPLWRTEPVVMMSLMNQGSSPGAALWVYAFLARNAANRVVYGELLFSGSYRFPAQVTFSGLQIRSENGQGVSIPADFTPFASAASGSGNLPGLYARIFPEDEVGFRAFLNLVKNPEHFFMQLEASGPERATLRGRLRKTDRMTLPISFDARNVVPPPANWQDHWVGTQAFHTVRNEDGTIAAAVFEWEGNMRCPEAVSLVGVHIHDGRAGANGAILYPMVDTAPVLLPTGFGTADGIRADSFMDGQLNELVNALVQRPENFYMDVHIERFPDGSTRGQFGQPPIAPVIDSVVSANFIPASTVAAPGGLISIFGRNLAKVGTNIDGWQGVTLPDSMNGVAVGIGSLRPKPILVSPSQITAVLPMETPSGTVQLAVNNGSALSGPFSLQVAPTAPALFAGPIVKVSDFSQISALNPAQAGDVILVYLTGLGQTTPPLPSGAVVDETNTYNTVPVTITVGGKEAQVLTSVASPGLPGLYQVVLRLPSGTGSGNTALVLHAGSTSSNPVTIPLR
jgi:uncharacterized protein (TIGR03437 family)